MPQYFTPIERGPDGLQSSSDTRTEVEQKIDHAAAPTPPATVLALMDSIEVALDAVRHAELRLKHASKVLLIARSEVDMIQQSNRSAWESAKKTHGRTSSLLGHPSHIQIANTTNSPEAGPNSSSSSHCDETFRQEHQVAESSMITQAELPVSPSASFRTSFSELDDTLDKLDTRLPVPPSRSQAEDKIEFAPKFSPLSSSVAGSDALRPISYASGLSSVWKAVFDNAEGNASEDEAVSPGGSGHAASKGLQLFSNSSNGDGNKDSRCDEPSDADRVMRPMYITVDRAGDPTVPKACESPTGLIQRFYSPRLVTARDSLVRVPSQDSLGPAEAAASTPKDTPDLQPRQSSPDLRAANATGASPSPSSITPSSHQPQERPASLTSASKGRWWAKTVDKIAPRRVGSREGLTLHAKLVSVAPLQEEPESLETKERTPTEAKPNLNKPLIAIPQEENGGEDSTDLAYAAKPGNLSHKEAISTRAPHPWSLRAPPAKTSTSSKLQINQGQNLAPAPAKTFDPSSNTQAQIPDRGKTSFEIRMNNYRQSTFFGSIVDFPMSPATATADPRQIDMCSPTLPLTDLLSDEEPVKDDQGEKKSTGKQQTSRAASRSSQSSQESKATARGRLERQQPSDQSPPKLSRGDNFGYSAAEDEDEEGGEDATDVLQLFMNGGGSVGSGTEQSGRYGKSSDSNKSDDSVYDEDLSLLQQRREWTPIKGSSTPTRAHSVRQEMRTPPGNSSLKPPQGSDPRAHRRTSLNSSSPSTPFKTLFNPKLSVSVDSPRGSRSGTVVREEEEEQGETGKFEVGTGWIGGHLTHDTAQTDNSLNISFGGSPLPKWEDRSAVNDWIRRKTKERGISQSSATTHDSDFEMVQSWRSATASASTSRGSGRWSEDAVEQK
ncbi:hypothetical protein CF327_g275 [Tilletia walkeri]|nr:hypothetical protein CF327_g275 [Tilletia walkeri]